MKTVIVLTTSKNTNPIVSKLIFNQNLKLKDFKCMKTT